MEKLVHFRVNNELNIDFKSLSNVVMTFMVSLISKQIQQGFLSQQSTTATELPFSTIDFLRKSGYRTKVFTL
jgi:hypothetical protein